MIQHNLQDNRFTQIVQRFAELPQALKLYSPALISSPAKQDEIMVLHGIVAADKKYSLLDNLSWLSEVQHIAYSYRRNQNGHRLLFSDGIFCELYLHGDEQLQPGPAPNHFPVVWQNEEYSSTNMPFFDQNCETSAPAPLVGELLTNIIIGLRRFARGEKYLAFTNIQQNALQHLLSLIQLWQQEKASSEELRQQKLSLKNIESRYPDLATQLPTFCAGYENSPDSAIAMLTYLEGYLPINHFVKDQILNLANGCIKSGL
ncbi:hypothetical protein KIH87_05185 [Paraneptunicella aestuarii]|uniref:hypothetical protein n=1 Tax=Paraneptunicella aestuarii TaxID=2831148 RepID=UPI001E2DE403|nr:hypothetical protein [Paraneptunicella aestuarii]UAA39754.1 hypothetical protein KIH87_05185 [Paraneptunicella aestuarii]